MHSIRKPVKEHHTHKSGEKKTVCVTAVLTSIGVPHDTFHYTGRIADGRRESILRRHGFAARSRMSRLPRGCSVGRARERIASWDDPPGTVYMVTVRQHLLLLDENGQTLVDTDPRVRDRRKILEIKAVFKKA